MDSGKRGRRGDDDVDVYAAAGGGGGGGGGDDGDDGDDVDMDAAAAGAGPRASKSPSRGPAAGDDAVPRFSLEFRSGTGHQVSVSASSIREAQKMDYLDQPVDPATIFQLQLPR